MVVGMCFFGRVLFTPPSHPQKTANIIYNMESTSTTDGTQRTHGEFQNNTNSCGSCHQTHSGATSNLLYKTGQYETCISCHDGTLGIYNVFSGSDSAGTFGGTLEGNMSTHQADGTVKIKAAPGGNRLAVADDTVWEAEFSCGSCHSPHGSYSDRLLNPNPNHMGNVSEEQGGKRLEGVKIVTNLDLANKEDKYVLNRFKLYSAADENYTDKGLEPGDTIIQLMKWNEQKGAYTPETDPWLRGYEYRNGEIQYWTTFFDGNEGKLQTDEIDEGAIFGNGFVGARRTNNKLINTLNVLDTANLARAFVVKLDVSTPDDKNQTITNVSTLWNVEDGRGMAMSEFCSACHIDYYCRVSTGEKGQQPAVSGGSATGIYDKAYRHPTDQDKFTCVRCHFAHGTDVTIMRDAQGKTVAEIIKDPTYFADIPLNKINTRIELATKYMIDENESSALKRYTNRAVCGSCHIEEDEVGVVK